MTGYTWRKMDIRGPDYENNACWNHFNPIAHWL